MHFLYLAWPDMGVPSSTDNMIALVKTVRSHVHPSMKGPLAIHCRYLYIVFLPFKWVMADCCLMPKSANVQLVVCHGEITCVRASYIRWVDDNIHFAIDKHIYMDFSSPKLATETTVCRLNCGYNHKHCPDLEPCNESLLWLLNIVFTLYY